MYQKWITQGGIQTENNMFVSLFTDMQHFNHNKIYQDREPAWSHSHEELVLQGRMTVTRTCSNFSLQGPHDILMAQAEVVTPAGIHHIRIYPDSTQGRHIGTFRAWDRDMNPPCQEHQRLLQLWCRELPVLDKPCMRQHRTAKEGRTCNGNPKPVMELSDPPRGVAPRPTGGRRVNIGPKIKGQGAMNRTGQASPRRYVPIAPKPSGNVFHFKASSKPGATVQIHSPPTPNEEVAMFPPNYKPMPEHIKSERRKFLLEKDLLRAGVNDYCQGATMMEGVINDMEKSLSKLAEVTENSQKLLDLYLCEEKKEQREIRKEMFMKLGVFKAEPCDPREQPQTSSTPPTSAAGQDPAIVAIQPSSISPANSVSSSIPSLVSEPSREESDSDCEIIRYTPPKRKRAITECQPVVVIQPRKDVESGDPIAQLAIGAEKLLLN